MKSCEIAVVGAGLAGLYAAWALNAAGIDFLVVEARNRLGGRIFSADASGQPSDDGFDLGPSWYWPAMQPAMASLISDLGLQSFAQNSEGDVVFERMSREGPQRYSPQMPDQSSMRLSGGTAAAVRAVSRELSAERILLGSKVTAMSLGGSSVRLTVQGDGGETTTIEARHVIAALPPRLLEASVTFDPPQDDGTAKRWRDTATWMAPHAKFFAIYDQPFWRTNGLSGTAQSMVGPLVEIHDATTASGKAAIFGFVGVPADQRATVGEDVLKAACVSQLVRLFGPAAGDPVATLLKDWAADPLTATVADLVGGGHPDVLDDAWVTGPWNGRLSLAGSETSPSEPGYLSGAVTAAQRAVSPYLSK